MQTWHGTPLKKIGCDVQRDGNAVTKLSNISKIYCREAKKITYMISPSVYCTDKLISAFNLKQYGKERIILETGYPRNDSLFSKTEEEVLEIKRRLGISQNKKVILYAPTFRDNKHSRSKGYFIDIGIDFKTFKEAFGKEYVVLFRAHYFIAKQINLNRYSDFVYDVSHMDDVNALYRMSDLLITDYSSVLFDYANLKKPMFFLMYDYKEYTEDIRDLYFGVSKLPGEVVHNQEELVRAIRTYDEKQWVQRYEAFCKEFNYLDGKDCGRKVAKMIIKNNEKTQNML